MVRFVAHLIVFAVALIVTEIVFRYAFDAATADLWLLLGAGLVAFVAYYGAMALMRWWGERGAVGP
jgi:hypothetical protein